MEALNPKIQLAGEAVADLVDQIKLYFKPPMRVTVLVRMPDRPDGSRDFILTDDDLGEVIAAIQSRKVGPSIVGAV